MSIFHFKAILKEVREDEYYVYTFYPDCVMAKNITGEFILKPNDWEPEIIKAADAEAKGLISTDKKCVLGLTAKIKEYFKENKEMPNEALRIS